MTHPKQGVFLVQELWFAHQLVNNLSGQIAKLVMSGIWQRLTSNNHDEGLMFNDS